MHDGTGAPIYLLAVLRLLRMVPPLSVYHRGARQDAGLGSGHITRGK